MLGKMYFTGNGVYQKFIAFDLKLSSLTLGNKKSYLLNIKQSITQKIKPFDINLEPTMSNLANDRVILKLNKSILVQKIFSSLYSN